MKTGFNKRQTCFNGNKLFTNLIKYLKIGNRTRLQIITTNQERMPYLPQSPQFGLKMANVIRMLNDQIFPDDLHRVVVSENRFQRRVLRCPREPKFRTQVRILGQTFGPEFIFVQIFGYVIDDLRESFRKEKIGQNSVTFETNKKHFSEGPDAEDSHQAKVFETAKREFRNSAELTQPLSSHLPPFGFVDVRIAVNKVAEFVSRPLQQNFF